MKSDLYAGIYIVWRALDSSAAKKKLAKAGYGGEPIVVTAPNELERAPGRQATGRVITAGR